MFGLSQSMNTTSAQNIDKLLNWKESRKNVFAESVSIPRNFSLEKVVDYHGSEEDIKIEEDPEQNENEVIADITDTEQEKPVETGE